MELPQDERAALAGSVPKRGETSPAPPTAALAALPAPPSLLVGRERDAKKLGGMLRRREARLLTLTGPGGVGKTSLALEVARDVAGDFPDGAFFVGLAPLSGADLVVPTVSRTFGLRETGELTSRETLLAYLSRKQVLLVLDNFEHLLGAAPEVARLLGSCPGLVLLVTSRAPLRVRGEREYPVEPLAVPDPSRAPDAEGVSGAPAAELFVDRAREANPSFSLTRKNAAAVAAICWRLDGLPLALELAAARARFLGPTELLSRLDHTLELKGARDLPERQKTMRSTLDWSHSLLSNEEKDLFRGLSVFAGGFSLEAAEAVGEAAGGDGVVGVLGLLVEQSLVAADTDAGENARYRMLEPVRQYALKKLEESGEEERVRWRHAEYYLELAGRARSELHGPRQAGWLDLLEQENNNVGAAMRWLLERGEAERVARIGWAISHFWSLRGHTGEGQRLMERALALSAEDSLSSVARAKTLWVDAMLSLARGENDRAVARAAESLTEARAAGDAEVLAIALLLRGMAALSIGDLDTAEQDLPRALTIFRDRDDPLRAAYGIHGLGMVTMARGDFERADARLEEADGLIRAAGDWFALAANLNAKALLACLRGGEEERAEALLRESIGLGAELRDVWTVVLDATALAGVAARRGRAERAARLFGAAAALSEKTGAEVSWSAWRSLNERDLATTREMLDPRAFEKAWTEGRAMTLEEAVAEVLAGDA